MNRKNLLPWLGAAALCLAAAVPAVAQDGKDKVYRLLPDDQLAAVLKDLKIDFKKTPADTRGVTYFDFTRNNYKVRLTNFDGKDLMLDSLFKGMALDKVNEWNRAAKFSRASLTKDKMGEFVPLEYNLDVIGGVTAGTVKQFLEQFDQELKNFDRFASGTTPSPAVADANILPAVTNESIENILNKLNLKFEKKTGKNDTTSYDFDLHNFKLRLYNFNGRDIMADAIFRKLPLEAVNKYNVDRKFIRAVAYNNNGKEYTSLEANFDCTAGVTEEMIRHFLVAYGEDVKHFANYVQNVK